MRLQETYTVWFRHYWSQINHFLCNLLKITKVNISAHYIRIHFISVLQSNLAKSVNDHGEMFIISFIPFLQDETISHISHISIFEALILNNQTQRALQNDCNDFIPHHFESGKVIYVIKKALYTIKSSQIYYAKIKVDFNSNNS